MALIDKKSVELLAPAGTWDAFTAAIDAGANAVYLGGKHFNMRVHRNDFNFDDDQLRRAIDYAHERGVKLYITINNLISDEELPGLEEYLAFLNEIKPDAVLVQDFAVVKSIRDMKLELPIHASIMMNIHSAPAIETLKTFGITRVVVSRELNLSQVQMLKRETGIETEYFIHGDMCISESGQCIHSGVLFGQSGNRGRCLKPCRWAWQLIDETSGEVLDDFSHRLALNDMCMIKNIPDLIAADVDSFKIEGRMRPPEFVHRIVSIYRRAIDRYLDDPTGYVLDADDWNNIYGNRVRDFTTSFTLSRPTSKDIGLSGEREPRFFSKAMPEPTVDDQSAAEIFDGERAIRSTSTPQLLVRVSTLEQAKAAVDNGADVICIGGEVFKPTLPLTVNQLVEAIEYAHALDKKLILNTPRTTYRRELDELETLLTTVDQFDERPDGIMVSNLGSLTLAKKFSLPLRADVSFNLFNPKAAALLKELGATMGAASLELSFSQLRSLVEGSPLPIEVLIHGSTESMICEHNFASMALDFNQFDEPARQFALVDEAGEVHSHRTDQFGRTHLYFGRDLCLHRYVEKFMGAASLRIDAQLYSVEQTARLVSIYRRAIDGRAQENEPLHVEGERPIGVGVYRFRQSKNS
ncbi:MAG: U32 family peptidase [Selenomonadaceae bacterium]|nr:U32 family peptidase [Selenomonadaceae bacterium]